MKRFRATGQAIKDLEGGDEKRAGGERYRKNSCRHGESVKLYANVSRRYDNGGKYFRSRTISQKCSASLSQVVKSSAGPPVYPNNGVVTVPFRAAAITRNLPLFFETTFSGYARNDPCLHFFICLRLHTCVDSFIQLYYWNAQNW